ncbi:hypothetical protein GXP67_28525 [Rhodocytophaga rosea]|uniref:Uncharacterized protein n=1 Tax=Rhodocytophaga rosea TaxID=2704465 RepID=A0A6C0GQV6_9BACT|nr:hypothetical protein [Rhodocytophaga rosea]QHT70317.1 hypothetical protein GXP67_28525 [Rhodocytophaga rosea]
MKTFINRFNQIMASSPEMIMNTKEYEQNVKNIKAEITLKYSQMIRQEKNAFKRVLLKIKKRSEIKKVIKQLTSLDKLYLVAE